MQTTQLAKRVLFGAMPGRISMIGTEGKSLRKGRFTSQARRLLQATDAIDERIWAKQAQDKQSWAHIVHKIGLESTATVATASLQCPVCNYWGES